MRRSLLRGMCCFLVAGAALVGGCAPSARTTLPKERTLALDEVMERVRVRNDAVRTLRGKGGITMESRDGSNSGSFDVRLKEPDSLRVDLRGPFGIRVGTLSLSRESFLFYNRMDNTALIGTPDGETLEDILHVNMQLDEILGVFTGEFPTTPHGDSLESFTVVNDLYVAVYRDTHGARREYHVDGDAFVVTGYRLLAADGTATVTALASSIVDGGEGVAMPSSIRVVFPKERRSVAIAYDEVEVNTPVTCAFTPPANAERLVRRK